MDDASDPTAPVTLANWRKAPHSAWAFHHVRELIPTAEIAARPGPPLPTRPRDLDLGELAFSDGHGRDWTLAGLMVASHTTGLVALHRGVVVVEHYAGGYDGTRPHILFSVSKSLTGTLAGVLVGDGLLAPEDPVVRHVPEVIGSAYGDCTVRHVLDMTVDTAFEESYLDQTGDYARYRRATGWNPVRDAESEPGLHVFLRSLERGGDGHGQVFRYRSPNSDLLGWVLERASGRRFADLLSTRIWQPLGCQRPADVTVDKRGAARAAGGISATPRDLTRFGEMMRLGGAYGDRHIVPADWVEDIRAGGDRAAWQRGDFADQMPDGGYRSQWYLTGRSSGAFCAIGIHGQWLYVDPAAEVVIAKVSAQPEPFDEMLDHALLEGFDALANRLAA